MDLIWEKVQIHMEMKMTSEDASNLELHALYP